ncbi:MAG: peptidoglycan-binding protein [Ruminococcus sp.]|nr:peptidoglycan-binding protein [Ruminococcus sp.]
MSYTDIQKKEHIRELQTYLYAISLFNDKIPQVLPTGIYNNDTSLAVRAFQREYGLPETGDTDPATWNRIIKVYKAYQHSSPDAYHAFPSASYIVHDGDKGPLIYIIQAMLNNISNSYDNFPSFEVCGNYNQETIKAVKLFQKQVGLTETGDVNSNTWNMLVHCCEHIDHTLH